MADDIWHAMSKGMLAFAHGRAGDLTQSTFRDTGSLVTSLFDGEEDDPGVKQRLKELKEQIAALAEEVKPLIAAVEDEAKAAAAAVGRMATELGTDPFTAEAAMRAATELGAVIDALGRAIDDLADAAAAREPEEAAKAPLRAAIKGIKEPWIAPFRGLAQDAAKGFDSLCNSVLGLDGASRAIGTRLSWDQPGKRLAVLLEATGSTTLGPITLDGAVVEGFFSFADRATLGVLVKARIKAGLRGDKLLQKIIPGQAPTADTEPTAVTLDTTNGLTFGAGADRRLTLPVRFAFPGLELRELAIARPPEEAPPDSGRIDLMATVAGRMGDAVGIVAEGVGAVLTWRGGDAPIEVRPRPPHAAGIRIEAGIVRGGGFLRHDEDAGEYGGVLDLTFAKFGVTAICLIGTEPFSLVVVLGVRFAPRIELGFGFTLGGLGGILALERRLDTEALRAGIRNGAIGTLLFPDDPVQAAPGILDRVKTIFPPQPGGFVVGPIAELGWGSQAGFVKAKVGLVLALPDPRIVLLGALQVGVPTAETPDRLRIVDLRAEFFAEFSDDYLLARASLINSKLATATVNGDLGLLVRWADEEIFAISIGGFFPGFEAPPELADLKRIAIEVSPPLPWITLRAEGYFAITASTLQFGGSFTLRAKVGPAEARAWLAVDALFEWAPRFRFVCRIDAGLEVKVFGETLVGVSFRGEISGTAPWRLEGRASIEILWWDIPIDIGPITWGAEEAVAAPAVSPMQVVAQALEADAAWTPRLPAGAESLVRLRPDEITPLLVHPLGALEARQLSVPLETEIDRIGGNPVLAPRVHLDAPRIGVAEAAALSHATDAFPPGQFIDMTAEDQASGPDFETFPCGIRLAATRAVQPGPVASAAVTWETVFPHDDAMAGSRTAWDLRLIAPHAFATAAVGIAARARVNPYALGIAPDAGIALGDAGLATVARMADSVRAEGVPAVMATSAARRLLRGMAVGQREGLQVIRARLAA